MEEKKPAASPDPAEQVEELLAQARQTAAGRVSRREMDAILESVRSQGAPEPSGVKRVRQGKTAPDEQDLIPEPEPEELSLPEQRRQTARQFFGAMFLTLILLGGVFGALLVEESYRRVGMGSLPTQVFSARLTEEGIAFTVGEAAPDPGTDSPAGLAGGPSGALPAAPGTADHSPGAAGRKAPAGLAVTPFPRFHTKKTG